jgi:hypothetical protein
LRSRVRQLRAERALNSLHKLASFCETFRVRILLGQWSEADAPSAAWAIDQLSVTGFAKRRCGLARPAVTTASPEWSMELRLYGIKTIFPFSCA